MEQTSFLPPPPLAPTWPQPGTLADKALEILMTGQGLTHPQFEAVTFSWRLAPAVIEQARPSAPGANSSGTSGPTGIGGQAIRAGGE